MRRLVSLGLLLATLLLPTLAWPRVGGGQSYSGSRSSSSSSGSRSSSSSSRSSSSSSGWGSSSSRSSSSSSWGGSSRSSSGGDGSLGGTLAFLAVGIILLLLFVATRSSGSAPLYEPPAAVERSPAPKRSIAERVQAVDPTFSEPVFLEWATLLFTRGQQARATGAEILSPWFDDVAHALPPTVDGRPLKGVEGVVVGSVKLTSFQARGNALQLTVAYRACLTATTARGPQAYYLEECWTFRRAKGVTSRVADDVERLGCPSCGSAFERDPMGACPHCNAPLRPGEHDWAVEEVDRSPVETRPPLLTSDVAEEGTTLPSVRSKTIVSDMRQFQQTRPAFSWPRFEERARAVFLELQTGWSEGAWEKLRALETESVFQAHRFWMDEYKKQGLRNVLADVKLARVEVVKVVGDACYDSVTCRMHASMRDSTIRLSDRKVVGGDPKRVRPFTEYWTFLQRPGAKVKDGATSTQCPSCAAPLKVSQAGRCEYCQGKLTSGQFDWVLTRIEQDEEYEG